VQGERNERAGQGTLLPPLTIPVTGGGGAILLVSGEFWAEFPALPTNSQCQRTHKQTAH
jgi:hypothetical protein